MLSKHNHYVQTRERNLKTDGFAKLVRNKITSIMGGGGGGGVGPKKKKWPEEDFSARGRGGAL